MLLFQLFEDKVLVNERDALVAKVVVLKIFKILVVDDTFC